MYGIEQRNGRGRLAFVFEQDRQELIALLRSIAFPSQCVVHVESPDAKISLLTEFATTFVVRIDARSQSHTNRTTRCAAGALL